MSQYVDDCWLFTYGPINLLLVALLSLIAACVPAPLYTVSGRVSGSWQCVDMASTIHPTTITLTPLGWTRTFTRSEPEFSFDNVREGDYTLVVACTALGSTFPAMPVTISGADLTVDVVLPFPQLPRSSPRFTLAGHTGRVHSLAFSPDGSELVSASDDGTMIRWNATDGRRINMWQHEHTDPLLPLSLSPDGTILAAVTEDGTIRLWDSVLGGLFYTLPDVGINVTNLTFSADGGTLAAWSDDDDGHVALWDVTSGEHLSSIKVVDGKELRRWPSKSIFFLPGGETLVSAVSDIRNLTISWWDAATGSRSKSTTLSSPQVQMLSGITSAAFSADGTHVALGMIGIENRGSVLIWDIANNLDVVGNYQSRLTQVDFSPDGTIVASTANDNSVVLWDANTGEARTILASDLESINTFAWSPSGRMLAAVEKRGTILLWEIPSYG